MWTKTTITLLALVVMAPIGVDAQVTHVITQVGTSFSPSAITIEAGDTVRWEWTSGLHTVTSGIGADARDAGALFDAPLSSGAPIFEFTFQEAGSVPFFCRPHESLGMTGTITVETATGAPDARPSPLRVLGVEPNPFNPRASLRFSLTEPASVSVAVYDLQGRRVQRLASRRAMEAGEHGLPWDGRDDAGEEVASGVYRFVVRAAGLEQVVSGVLVR